MMYANKLNENCKLETFLVSENNKQAYDACRKLLDEPKHTDYDPILVYGEAGWDEDEENYYNAIELLSQANKDDENEEQCEEEQLKRLSAWMVAYKAERDYDKYCFEKELEMLKQSLQ